MLLTTFFNTTKILLTSFFSALSPSPNDEAKVKVLENMADGKLYVENVRAFFNIPKDNAQFICDQAVREGVFVHKVGVLCQNSDCRRIIYETTVPKDIPDVLTCENCDDLDINNFEFEAKNLDKVEFYVLAEHVKE